MIAVAKVVVMPRMGLRPQASSPGHDEAQQYPALAEPGQFNMMPKRRVPGSSFHR